MKQIQIIGLILFVGVMGHLSITSFLSMIENFLIMETTTGANWAGLWAISTYLAIVAVKQLIHEVKKTIKHLEV